ncbi:uncharacterized protein DUF2510 [Actinocorallia herbida]|uniref:Uncharacterized protein DUF2510 n=1 Tax=Actinocorallia herbida TaxID=58109 RepID=A0A3N1D7T9_9ACTN|nr:DUF2510 domain-containing protein [Actinocorallia herbida]ROO89592.1 uncharacterized protein DUF2510 [Actinocorallia herbida]
MNGQTPPGWYPDPYGNPGLQRWFDGTQWTQATQPTGPSAPSSWQPQAGGTPPPWQPQAGGTPQPWQPPSGGPGTPAPWGAGQPVPGPPRQNNRGLLMILGGAGVLVVVIALVAVLISVLSDDDPEPPVVLPTPTSQGSKSPVTGTIDDSDSGLSWPKLGGDWTEPADPEGDDSHGLHTGQTAIAQKAYDGVGDYYASVYGGVLPESVTYAGGAGADLEAPAKAWFEMIEPDFYPEHETTETASRVSSVSGKKAWYYEAVLKFPQAADKKWNFTTERVIIVLVDRPGSRPAGVYLSLPDSFANQSDVDTIISGLKSAS